MTSALPELRFGMFVPQGWRLDLLGIAPENQWTAIVDLARRADYGPWDSVWVYDHFHTAPVTTHEATHEAWTLLAALAAATHNVKLGQMCTCMGYRNPVYLAKVAATVDVISGGRAQMGIGAGWHEEETEAYGYRFPPLGERISRLEEGVQIFTAAWQDGIVTFDGRYFQANAAVVRPRPLQEGGIPLWIAGGGEKRTLRIAAEFGDYSNFSSDPEEFAHKSAILAEHCRDIGRDPNEIIRSTNINVIIGRTAAEVRGRLATLRARLATVVPESVADTTVAGLASQPTVGTVSEVIAAIERLRALGMGYLICYFPEVAYDPSSLTIAEREVLTAVG